MGPPKSRIASSVKVSDFHNKTYHICFRCNTVSLILCRAYKEARRTACRGNPTRVVKTMMPPWWAKTVRQKSTKRRSRRVEDAKPKPIRTRIPMNLPRSVSDYPITILLLCVIGVNHFNLCRAPRAISARRRSRRGVDDAKTIPNRILPRSVTYYTAVSLNHKTPH